MMRRAAQRQSAGFTLIEVLISTALVSVVLALALRGFTEANKIADLTKTKVVAKDEATLGVEKMAKIIRRCHIIYFDAHPIPNHGATNASGVAFANNKFSAATGEATFVDADFEAIPTTLLTKPDDVKPLTVRWGLGKGSFPSGVNFGTFNRHDFRFMTGGVAGQKPLRSGDTSLVGAEGEFPSPLFYGAEATFNTSNTATDTTQIDPSLPVTWTFYLMYLAPMAFDIGADSGHALFPAQTITGLHGQRDAGRKASDGAPYHRSTVPYEIRLLTIPDVLAVKFAASNPAVAANVSGDKYLGRRLIIPTVGVGTPAPGPDGVKKFPHDVAPSEVNYDPLPLGIELPADLSRSIAEYTPSAGSGARVNGLQHGNFNNIGNDPPAEACFADGQRRHWNGVAEGPPPDPSGAFGAAEGVSDTLVARYIDPDATSGTFVRLAADEAWRGINTNNRAYVNAYGGPQRWRQRLLNGAPPPALSATTLRAPPKRAQISVTTRYRSSTAIPFSFSTESVEVDLEALSRYQSQDRISN